MPIICTLGGASSRAIGGTGGGGAAIFTIGSDTYNLGAGDVFTLTITLQEQPQCKTRVLCV